MMPKFKNGISFYKSKIIAIFHIIFCYFFLLQCQAAPIYNVKDFGAVGDGVKDDIVALEKCVKAALLNKSSKVIMPFGTYKISRTLKIDFLDQEISISGITDTNGKNPTIFLKDNSTIVHIKGFLFESSKGIISFEHINLLAINTPYNANHEKINADAWYAGLLITDKKAVYIRNVNISNVYGQGIYVSTTQQEGIPLSSRFAYVEIVNCNVTNVWGYHPKKDSYGDGIYVSNVAKGLIKNNKIYNNISVTKQLGRCGIVIEYMAENIQIINNNVLEGYDRSIHIENTLGGHKIFKNKFYGSDLSLVLFEPRINENFLPILITQNIFSNVNMPKNIVFNKVYNRNSFGDRALLFIKTSGQALTKKLIFDNNSFIVNGNYVYESNSLINNRSNTAIFTSNIYRVINMAASHEFGIYNYSKSAMKDNKIFGNIKIK